MQEAQTNASAPAADPRSPEEVKAAIQKFRDDYNAVRDQIERVVVGHREIIDGVLTCLFTGGHALLEGVPGLGKTLLIRSLSQALSLDFNRIQFTPDLMPADVTGTTIVVDTQEGRAFKFQKGPIFAQIVLADEINRATPKTQSALLEAMQEKSVTVEGTTHELKKPFFVMATQNPIEQEGTYPLPEAQLDRFFFKLVVGYSSREDLWEILKRTTAATEPEISSVLDGPTILAHQRLIRRAAIADRVQDYAVRLTLATHPGGEFASPMVNKFVRFGVSPRAAQALVLGAKCRALLEGRATVSIDDIRSIALPTLRHRILINFEGEAEGVTTEQIVENLVSTMPVEAGAMQKNA
ncbi:MAG: AAA family ATPase [Phycisphaeraceae bacterium]|nr:MAG: AAA family ATPase [Phycisphaeraceae bacterium]